MVEFTLGGLLKPTQSVGKNALSSSFSFILWSILISCMGNAHIVKVEDGFLRGEEAVSKNGRKYYEFCGIPYAAPPVGDLRFKPPQSPSSWKGVRSSQRPPSCIQPSGTDRTKGQEDCLYLNVYKPLHIAALSHQLPVIIFFHGGGFKYGDGISNNPKYFMGAKDPVIFVTLNHRLGPLGYLSMNNDKLPGNYGLKDQLMALKWISRNIKSFGGNPKSVTLMGQSSGGVCVELHLFSEKSRGLFHKAIVQSGPTLSSYAFHYPNAAKAVATNLLLKTGCLQNDSNKTLSCLRQLKAELLTRISAQITNWGWSSEPCIFRPTLEYYGDLEDRFLSVDPRKSRYLSKVPCLHGHTAADGVLLVVEFLKNNLSLLRVLNETYPRFLPVVLDFNHTVNTAKDFEKIASDIIKFYFGDSGIYPDKIKQLVQLFTDGIFAYSTVKSVLNQNVSHYVYVFDHRGFFSFQRKVVPEYDEELGAGHTDELPYLFYSETVDKNMTEADKKITETMINYWTNFATYGNPDGMSKNKTWTKVTSRDVEYFHIESKSQKMQKGLTNDRFHFWNSIFSN